MILGFHPDTPSESAYWYGRKDGVEEKYSRVAAGLALPVYERQKGAIVVIGELYRPSTPNQDFTVLGTEVSDWLGLERASLELEKSLQYRTAIMERDEMRPLFWKIRGMNPLVLTWYAPDYALTEVGRQKVDALAEAGKLHVNDEDQRRLGSEPEIAGNALKAVICYALDYPVIYKTKSAKQPVYEKVWGVKGL